MTVVESSAAQAMAGIVSASLGLSHTRRCAALAAATGSRPAARAAAAAATEVLCSLAQFRTVTELLQASVPAGKKTAGRFQSPSPQEPVVSICGSFMRRRVGS